MKRSMQLSLLLLIDVLFSKKLHVHGEIFTNSIEENEHMNIARSHEYATPIIGGEFAPFSEYKWFAKTIDAEYNNVWMGCGGMLISPQYILSAAHCEGSIGHEWEINAKCHGSFSEDNGNCDQPREIRTVSKVIIHPKFDYYYLSNDFALVKLSSPITNIRPVPLDSNKLSKSYENGKKLWVVGFGVTDVISGETSERLKHVEVKYEKNEKCERKYLDLGYEIPNSMMCAADVNKDACQGDSGGALYDKENDVLVGIVSWGEGCADPNYTGVYARVSNQYWWIKRKICNDPDKSARGDFCDDITYSPTLPTNPSPAASPIVPLSPTPLPSIDPNICKDDPPNWIDYMGDNCQDYERYDWCEFAWQYPSSEGVTALQACCSCGGGTSQDDNECVDSKLKMSIKIKGKTKVRGCDWVRKVPEKMQQRCSIQHVRGHCAATCGGNCKRDSQCKWLITLNNVKVKQTCDWVKRKNTALRCSFKGVSDTCRQTCSSDRNIFQ